MVDVENGDKRERKKIGRSDGSRVLTVWESQCRRNVLRARSCDGRTQGLALADCGESE